MSEYDSNKDTSAVNLAQALLVLAEMGEDHPGLAGACRSLGVDVELILGKRSKAAHIDKMTPEEIRANHEEERLENPTVEPEKPLSRQTPWAFYLTAVIGNQKHAQYNEKLLEQLVKQPSPELTICDGQNTGFAAVNNDCDANLPPEPVIDVANVAKLIQEHKECDRKSQLTDGNTLVRQLAKGELPNRLPKNRRLGRCSKLLVLLDYGNHNAGHYLDFVLWQQALAKVCGQWLHSEFIHILNWQPLRWRNSQLHRDAVALEKPCYDPLPEVDSQTVIVMFLAPWKMQTPHFTRWWSNNRQRCGGVLQLSLYPTVNTLCPEQGKPWQIKQIDKYQSHWCDIKDDILSCLSTTPGRLTQSMVRRLRKEVFNAPLAVETNIFNNPDISWARDNGCGYWVHPEKQRLQQFVALPQTLQIKAANIIQTCLPQAAKSLRFEHALLVNQIVPQWGENHNDLVQEAWQWFNSVSGEILRDAKNTENARESEKYASYLYHLDHRHRENTTCLPKAIKQAIVVNNYQLGKKYQGVPPSNAVDAELQQALSSSEQEYQPKRGHLIQTGTQWQLRPEQEGLPENGLTLVQIDDIHHCSLHQGDFAQPLVNHVDAPQNKTPIQLKNPKQQLDLHTFSSLDFYWAESVLMDNTGVTATTAEGIQVYWSNLPGRSHWPEITLPDNAPQWLKRYWPAWDEYGLFVDIVVDLVSFKLRYIPPGSFLMGSPESEKGRHNNEKQHSVSLSQGFWMGDTTVTQALWVQVMGDNPSHFQGNNEQEHPVETVTWQDAIAFCSTLNEACGLHLTLPTEACWEYACRAESHTAFAFGEQLHSQQAHFNQESGVGTMSVAHFDPNYWGLHQMHGNLWEWCLDDLRDYEDGAVIDPSGLLDSSGAALRGGSWGYSGGQYCRSACRIRYGRDFRFRDVGLRVSQGFLPETPQAESIAGGESRQRALSSREGVAQSVVKSDGGASFLPQDGDSPSRLRRLLNRDTSSEHKSDKVPVPDINVNQTEITQNPLDLAAISTRQRWQLRPPEDPFPAPWASGWGFDKYGLWQSFTIAGISQKLRYIPPGQVLMGSPDTEKDRRSNETQHQVTLTKGFWLGETTITQALWLAVMGKNPSYFNEEQVGQDTSAFPVEQISWHDALTFCEKINQSHGLSLSLPTEAQWEYACRANSQTAFFQGDTLAFHEANFGGYEKRFGNLSDTEKAQIADRTCFVDAYFPNSWGLYQMHGNVSEWCLDDRREYTKDKKHNPMGEIEARSSDAALRGGSWGSNGRGCRSACRFRLERDFRRGSIGLRVSQETGNGVISPQVSRRRRHKSP